MNPGNLIRITRIAPCCGFFIRQFNSKLGRCPCGRLFKRRQFRVGGRSRPYLGWVPA